MSTEEALEIVGRVKAGQDIEAILAHVRDGNLLLQLRLVPESRFRYELPYMSEMPAFLLAGGSPYFESLIYEVASLHSSRSQPQGTAAASVARLPMFPREAGDLEHQSQYLKPYHAAELVEPLLEKAKPSLWTSVSKDDGFMRALLGAYFAHEYHSFPVFHKDYFLENMASQQTSHCCSSLLVNATLAFACVSLQMPQSYSMFLMAVFLYQFCYAQIPNRFEYWNPKSLGYQFLAEARRIWELQTSSRKFRDLTTAQAACMISLVYNASGLDKIGAIYQAQGIAIAHELKLFDGSSHVRSERLRGARDFTAWALFNLERYAES